MDKSLPNRTSSNASWASSNVSLSSPTYKGDVEKQSEGERAGNEKTDAGILGQISPPPVHATNGRNPADEQTNSRLGSEKTATRPSVDADGNTYPEGGLQAWLVVFGSFFGMFVVSGTMNSVGIIQAYLAEHQLKGYDESTIGWIFSIYVFLAFFGGLQIGPIFDAKGPRLLIISGCVLTIISMLLLGLCTKYWHFILTFSLINGTGAALIFTPAIASIGHYFLQRRGNATGIAAAGASLGGVAFPLILQRLLPTLGFAWSTRIMAFIFIALSIIPIVLVRSRLPPKTGASVFPDLKIFKDVSFSCATMGVFFMEWGLFVPISFLSSYAVSKMGDEGGGAGMSFALVAILNGASSLGRWVPGLVADRWGRFNCMIVTLAMCGAVTVGLWLPATYLSAGGGLEGEKDGKMRTVKGLVVAYAALFGLFSGSNISLTPVCLGQLCETQSYGRYYATCYTVVSFGTLTGIPIAGALVKACGGEYYGLVLFTGASYLFATVMFVVARWKKVGMGWRAKF